MRSLLFVPGDSDRKLERALESGAGALIFDLEDSVTVERKPVARQALPAFVAALAQRPAETRPRLYVRINPMSGNDWPADLAAIGPAAPNGVMLPKPNSGEDVHRLSVALHHAEDRNGHKDGSIHIIAIVTETAASLLNMASYIGCTTRLEGMTWGAEDLSAEIGSMATRNAEGEWASPFRLARDLTLLSAVAAGVAPIDTVYIDFRDETGLRRECEAAARDGFVAKLAIHPDQVPVINEAFTPSQAQVARAEAIVRLFAESPDAGVVSFEGAMLDRPHLLRAKRVLARAGRSPDPPV
jgi:citrate lyase subunit beta/citryl-CoA lyase